MTITLKTTFELEDNVTLEAINKTSEEHVGTLVIKDGVLTYHNLITRECEEYTEDNVNEFEDFINEYNLEFKKSRERKYVNFQPNPKKNNTTDCTFRAYAKAEGITWEEGYDIASRYGRDMKLMPNDHKVVDKIIRDEFGYNFTKLEKGSKKTVNEFAIEHPNGTYILWMHAHVVTVVDGNYYDSWDSGDRKIKGYYIKVKREV